MSADVQTLTIPARDALRKYAVQRFEMESDDYVMRLNGGEPDNEHGRAILAAAEVYAKARDDSPQFTPTTTAWLEHEREQTRDWIKDIEGGENDKCFPLSDAVLLVHVLDELLGMEAPA